jgi:hypothetical protein
MKGDFILPAQEKDDASTSVIATHDDMSWVSELAPMEKQSIGDLLLRP